MLLWKSMLLLVMCLVFDADVVSGNQGLLYPRESETREVKSLDGIWNFLKSDPRNSGEGIRDKWFADELSRIRPTIDMPVPSSYNDITESASLRDHVGTVWYDRKFFVPKSWEVQKVWIRFGSVNYASIVWINGIKVVDHEIGHLPFEAEISNVVKYGAENRVTVLCDNVLQQTTVPQGKTSEEPVDNGTEIIQMYTFDFFNYAGIHRSVILYTTPQIYIEDVTLTTDIVEKEGHIYYKVDSNLNDTRDIQAKIRILDRSGIIVSTDLAEQEFKGVALITNVYPWWPYLMHPDPGYLYTMEISLILKSNNADEEEIIIDVYRLKIGVRTLRWDKNSFQINGKPIYFRGFGRHEDFDIRGKGLDLALVTKDFNLLKWVGANAYRTSHYPYSEESMQFADARGIMIIDECPGVNLENYTLTLLDTHKESLRQLIHRDKNHPSAIMWSIANEPRSQQANADLYFQEVSIYTRTLDSTRPITASLNKKVDIDKAGQFLDIISFNRYNAWYQNPGKLDMITNRVVEEAKAWNQKHNKPVLMSEYGADTMEGYHTLPSYIWTEEYQSAVFSKHFKAFDILRTQNFFIGEFVWNFADFKTAQTYTRVGGNKKGVFTRNRQPKAAAYVLRKRYHELASELDNSKLPDDLQLYTSNKSEL